MKIIPTLLMYANLFCCFAAVLYVLKEIIHNKDASTMFCGLILILASINFTYYKEINKDIRND